MSAARMVLQGISQRRSEKCVEIDKKIERYRSILRSIRFAEGVGHAQGDSLSCWNIAAQVTAEVTIRLSLNLA